MKRSKSRFKPQSNPSLRDTAQGPARTSHSRRGRGAAGHGKGSGDGGDGGEIGEGRKASKGRKYVQSDHIFLYGLHTVRAALNNPQRKILHLYVTENALPRLQAAGIEKHQGLVETVVPARLDQMVGKEAVHQGVVAQCAPLDMLDASELFHLAEARLILVLDQITDPHNAGAILRSACAIGADAVLTTSRNSAQETSVMAKAASGALDNIRLIALRNLSKGIAELNEMGFISIGLDSDGPEVLQQTLRATQAQKVVLVLGSENKGLRQKTRETCTALARLDMAGPIKSLNVSNAATLSLYVVASHLAEDFG